MKERSELCRLKIENRWLRRKVNRLTALVDDLIPDAKRLNAMVLRLEDEVIECQGDADHILSGLVDELPRLIEDERQNEKRKVYVENIHTKYPQVKSWMEGKAEALALVELAKVERQKQVDLGQRRNNTAILEKLVALGHGPNNDAVRKKIERTCKDYGENNPLLQRKYRKNKALRRSKYL